MAANGASWDRPPRRLDYGADDLARVRELIDTYAEPGPWGFKDPRTLLTLALWREAVPDLQCVGIFRHPRAVAESLRRRSGGRIEVSEALSLWRHYNELLLDAWERDRFPILCFDGDEIAFREQLDPLPALLGLSGRPGVETFYSPDLLHYQGGSWEGVPRPLRRLYQKLAEAGDTWREAATP